MPDHFLELPHRDPAWKIAPALAFGKGSSHSQRKQGRYAAEFYTTVTTA